MEKERKQIVKKYAQNLDKIIKKYENLEDDDLQTFNLFGSEEYPTFNVDSISFIKNTPHKSTISSSSLLLFQDIYKMLCSECSFEDIYLILNSN